MRPAGYALIIALLGAAPPPTEAAALMARIESMIAMPRGASRLTLYDRYYAWENRDDGVRKVLGTYVRGPQGRRHWVNENELPLVMDGGCDIVTLTYDLDTDRIERVECNGEA